MILTFSHAAKRVGKNMKRENFNSRIGFILVSAGCAIGIGNVWKFPYLAGQNGGGYPGPRLSAVPHRSWASP